MLRIVAVRLLIIWEPVETSIPHKIQDLVAIVCSNAYMPAQNAAKPFFFYSLIVLVRSGAIQKMHFQICAVLRRGQVAEQTKTNYSYSSKHPFTTIVLMHRSFREHVDHDYPNYNQYEAYNGRQVGYLFK